MNPFTKEICVLAAGLLSPGIMMSENPEIILPDYTSKISIVTLDNHTVSQQVGAYLSSPKMTETSVTLIQGLFGLLTNGSGMSAGIGNITFNENDSIEIFYDASLNTLIVTLPEDYGNCRYAIADSTGKIIISEFSDEPATTIDISTLEPGMYVAAVVAENKSYKSFKFFVK